MFRAPPAGTGTLTFHTLLKVGPANVGEFYWPAVDLVLTEAPRVPSRWVQGGRGASCDAACAAQGEGRCDALALQTIAGSGAKLVVAALGGAPVRFPAVADCTVVSPGSGLDQTSYYHATTDCVAPAASTCEASHPDVRRFCHCKLPAAGGGRLRRVRMLAQDADVGRADLWLSADDRTHTDVHVRAVHVGVGVKPGVSVPVFPLLSRGSNPSTAGVRTSSAARARPVASAGSVSLAAIALLAAASSSSSSSPSSRLAIAAGLFATLLVPQAGAHNWMQSPGRANTLASTVKPCLSRKATDIHAQVGKGDSFTVRHASGHGGAHYLALIDGDHEHELARVDFKNVLQEYIDDATSPNLALDQRWQRYHGNRRGGITQYADGWVQSGSTARVLKRQVPVGDPYYLDHTLLPNDPNPKRPGGVFQYEPAFLSNEGDKRVSYQSKKYPWLLSVYIYKQTIHDPGGFDATRHAVPDWAKSGHYVVHWIWQGYYDCVDVNYFADRTNMANIDGLSGTGAVWNRIDHCQHDGPNEIVSPSRLATQNASACIDHITAQGISMDYRIGVTVVPYTMPAAVTVENPHKRPIYDDFRGVGSRSSWARVPGTDTTNDVNWNAWKRRVGSNPYGTTQHGDKTCSQMDIFIRQKDFRGTLREAVLACSEFACMGIVWKQGPQPSSAVYVQDSVHTFEFCGGKPWGAAVTLKDAVGFRTFLKDVSSVPVPTLAKSDKLTFWVSFQAKDLIVDAGNFSVDSGKVFGANGAVGQPHYGWNCESENVFRNYRASMTVDDTAVDLRVAQGYCGPGLSAGSKTSDILRKWSVKVPNGAYRVTAKMGMDLEDPLRKGASNQNTGCTVENTQLWSSLQVTNTWSREYSADVFVRDGMLDLTSRNPSGVTVNNRQRCSSLSYLKVERLTTAAGMATPKYRAWFPSSNDPFWQRALTTSQAIGQVTVRPPAGSRNLYTQEFKPQSPDATDNWDISQRNVAISTKGSDPFARHSCRARFLFSGSECIQTDPSKTTNNALHYRKEQGHFNETNQGFEVVVGNTPCTGVSCTKDASDTVCVRADRMAKGRMVAKPDEPNNCGTRTAGDDYCPMLYDCQGATGKYVKVLVKGIGRIFDATVEVRYAKPPAPADSKVCYGVHARTAQSLPIPLMEFVTSDDPEDPVFYSTCYVREREILWEATGNEQKPSPPKWRFGTGCLDCALYSQNKVPDSARSAHVVPSWATNDKCIDCALGSSSLAAASPVIPGTPLPGDGGVGGGSAIGGGTGGAAAAAGTGRSVVVVVVPPRESS